MHACGVTELAFWQGVELWRAELGGTILDGHRQVIGQRGRLVEWIAS